MYAIFPIIWSGPAFRRAVRLSAALLFVLGGLSGLVYSGRAEAAQGAPVVRVVELDGAIDNVASRYVTRSLDGAVRDGVSVVIIRLDTPGGLLDATRTIVERIFASPVPVVVYVAPEGAQAASAGTFVGASASVLAMAPATNIGAASVVGPGGEDLPETISKKANEDAAAFIRSIADRRGRNGDALETAVSEASAWSASEAAEVGISDLVASDLNELLEGIDGMEVEVSGGSIELDTGGALEIEFVDMNLIERSLSFLADPNIAFLLVSLGGLALVIELWNFGLWIPGTLGVMMLLLGFAGVGNLPFSWAGVGLLALAIVLFFMEAQAPGVGFFGAGGTVALILGGIFLVGFFGAPEIPGPALSVNRWLLYGLAIAAGLTVLWFANEVRRSRTVSGYASPLAREQIVGQNAVVEVKLAPSGEVRVAGESWLAELEVDEGVAEVGETVVVSQVDNIRLVVARQDKTETETDGETGRA